MSDINSGLPIRSQYPSQVNYNDVILKIGDATNPTTQIAAVDTHGSLSSLIKDASGNAVTTQANGAQRALDVGINVAGVQIDPRLAGQYNATLPTLTTGSFTAPQTDINGRLLAVTNTATDAFPATQAITAQDTASTSSAQFNQTWFTGTPTAGSAASFVLSSNETGMIEVTGTWTGTLQIETSVDTGTNWIAHSIHLIGSTIFISAITGNAAGSLNLSAKTNVRVRATTAWTGTATVKLIESANASSVYVANAIKLVDGSSTTSSTTATILAASTAASTTNTALVVALSPNSPLPAGSALIGAVNIEASGTALSATSGALNIFERSAGPVAPGTAASNSDLAGGVFNSTPPTLTNGQQAALQLDAAGRLLVDVANGGAALSTSDLADGAVANGTAGTKSMLGGGIYLSSAPTLTSGNQNALMLDVNGNLKVDLATSLPAGSAVIGAVTQSGGPWTQNLTQVGGSAIALGQTTMSASLPVTIASNQTALPVSQSTSPWITSDLADGSVAAGTAGTKSMLGGLVFNTAAPSLTTGQQVALQGDVAGNLKVNLQTAIPAGTNSIGTVVLGAGTAIAGKIEITDGTNTSGVTAASAAASATQPALVVALSPNSPVPAGTNAIGSVLANLQVASSPVSATNPVPVTISDQVPGTPIQSYGTSVAVAAGASATITYTVVTGHTFTLERVWASASGKIKAVVQNNGSTIMVGFNSTANPNIDMTFVTSPTIAAAATVTVTITNMDLLAFDVYATIEGNQN